MAKKTLKRNEDGEKLRMYLIGLPLKDSSKMVTKLAEACKVPLHTVHNWRAGLCRIPESCQNEKIFFSHKFKALKPVINICSGWA